MPKFQKGVSGNPAGRPKGSGQPSEFMELFRQKIPFERLVGALDKLVNAGDPKSIQYCVDRHLGRPAQAIQISGDAERPLHGLLGVVGREMLPAPTEVEGELAEEEEPDDTGGP